jgi:hypothetical protein
LRLGSQKRCASLFQDFFSGGFEGDISRFLPITVVFATTIVKTPQ